MFPKKYYVKPKDDRFNQTVRLMQYITRRVLHNKRLHFHEKDELSKAHYFSNIIEYQYLVYLFGNQAENLL